MSGEKVDNPSAEGKHPGGRPTKYKVEYEELVFKACSIFGADDIKLADFIGITKSTLNKWKKEYPLFMDSLKRGKDLFDCNIAEKKLYSRVEGYDYIEKTTEAIVDKDGKITELKRVKNVTKHVPPDVGACFGWLYNRNRGRWKNRKALELSGPDGAPIEQKVTIYLPENKRDE